MRTFHLLKLPDTLLANDNRLPFSYHLCTTRHARHSFSLDYSPRVVVLTNPVHMDVKTGLSDNSYKVALLAVAGHISAVPCVLPGASMLEVDSNLVHRRVHFRMDNHQK
jgi:hypothetical protein